MAEPDWDDKTAVRDWLEQRYPVANKQTGSPFLQYLLDEQRKGNAIEGRERHLAPGYRGEFLKWVFKYNGNRTMRYQGRDYMWLTYYDESEYYDERSDSEPETLKPSNTPAVKRRATPKLTSNNKITSKKPTKKTLVSPQPEPLSEKSGTAKVTKFPLKRQRKPKSPAYKEDSRTQKERLGSLRPRRNCLRPRTGMLESAIIVSFFV